MFLQLIKSLFVYVAILAAGFVNTSLYASECTTQLSLLDDNLDRSYSNRSEVHSLLDLVNPDPLKNLAVLHPSMVMNAAQRINSWVESIPHFSIPDPLYGAGSVEYFPVFSEGIPEVSGKMIVGQHAAINTIMSYVRAAARGDGAAVKQPLLTGPAGTGKSEFLSILGLLATGLESSNPDYHLYTYRWKGLEQIPAIRQYFEIHTDAAGKELSLDRDAPIKRSPLVLLPEDVQKKVIELATPRSIQLCGYAPRPILKPDSQSAEIRNLILDHYRKLAGKVKLTNREIVEILAKHVDIIRRPLDGAQSFPTLSAQGNDVPYDEIFFSKNAFNFNTFGADNPFSYFYTGKVLQGDGGPFVTDEWWRNRPELRDVFLDVIEDRVVQRGGSPREELDVFIIGAGNDESLDDAKAKSGVKAQVDRAVSIPMRLATNPWEVAKTMLLMKNPKTLSMKKLDAPLQAPGIVDDEEAVTEAPEAQWEPVNLSKLFPIPRAGESQFVGPYRRYALRANYRPGAEPVFIAPHTLEFMSYVVASTRFVTNPKEAMAVGNRGVVRSAVFSDIVARLKAITGDLELQPDEKIELKELSNLLKEGSKGLSNRDAANAWLHHLIEVASTNPDLENTITPALALEELDNLLQQGKITSPDHPTRMQWMQHAVQIGNHFVIGWISSDVMEATNADKDSINNIYDEIKFELLALAQNPNAQEYSMPGSRPRMIRKDRLARVRLHYRQATGRNLVEGEIMNFHTRYASEPGKRFPQLLKAINAALAESATETVGWDALAEFGKTRQGGHAIQTKYSSVEGYLIRTLGYNAKSVRMALDFKQQLQHIRSKLQAMAQ